MPKFKFTDSFLRKKHNQNTEYSDEYISGLRIRIRNNHKKVFSYQYSLNGKKTPFNYWAVSIHYFKTS